MKMIGSLVVLLFVIGVLAWWGMQNVSRDVGIVVPQTSIEGAPLATPIDQAKGAKQLLERNGMVVE